MQVTSKEEIFKPYLCLFSGSSVVCLDNRFCVVSCEGSLLESGECVLKSVRETVPEPLGVGYHAVQKRAFLLPEAPPDKERNR